jgi:hypothetical protein
MANAMPISPLQVLAFTSKLAIQQGGMSRGGDNRLIQPLNNRPISASFTPPAGSAVVITGAIKLAGLTAATFTPLMQTNFKTNMATALAVPVSAVSITFMDTTARRQLRATSLNVAYSVSAPTAAAAQVVGAQLNYFTASPTSLTALATAVGATGAVVSTAPGVGAPPAPAMGPGVPMPISAAPRAAGAVVAVVAAAAAALAF